MVISIFSNYQQKQILVYAQQVVKILRRSDGGKSIKMSFKNVRYSAQKTVSNHLKVNAGELQAGIFETACGFFVQCLLHNHYTQRVAANRASALSQFTSLLR